MNSMDAKLSDIPRNYRESYLKAMSGKAWRGMGFIIEI